VQGISGIDGEHGYCVAPRIDHEEVLGSQSSAFLVEAKDKLGHNHTLPETVTES
jgi:hypothetical protein